MPNDENLRPEQWGENIQEGEVRIVGCLQVDIAKSSELEGPEVKKQETKSNLNKFVTAIINSYDGVKLNWAGDGGSFLFLLSNPRNDYDNMVECAYKVLFNMPFFNLMKGSLNLLKQDINLRISCHQGQANYSCNPEDMHGEILNYFLKYEREIGHPSAVTITEDVYTQLMSDSVKNLFKLTKEHKYKLGDEPYNKKLYMTKGKGTELPIDDSLGIEAAYAEQSQVRNDIYSLLESSTEVRILAISLVHLTGEHTFGNVIAQRLRAKGKTQILLMSPTDDMEEEIRLRRKADSFNHETEHLDTKDNIIGTSNAIRSIVKSKGVDIDEVLRFYRHYPPCSIYMGDKVALITLYILEPGSKGFTIKLHGEGQYFKRVKTHFDFIWNDKKGTKKASDICKTFRDGESTPNP